jgi:hypothetical protein
VESIAASTTLFVDAPWHIGHMAVQDDYLMRLYHMVHGTRQIITTAEVAHAMSNGTITETSTHKVQK